MNSTVTLPSEDSESRGVEHDVEGAKKKRHGGRLGLMNPISSYDADKPPPGPDPDPIVTFNNTCNS